MNQLSTKVFEQYLDKFHFFKKTGVDIPGENNGRKVMDLKQNHNMSDDWIKKGYQRIWKKLKNTFIVSSYMEIPKVNFDDCCIIVKNVNLGDLI